LNQLNQLPVGRPAFNAHQPVNVQTTDQPMFAVMDVNMARLVIADEPFQNITAAPDFAHELKNKTTNPPGESLNCGMQLSLAPWLQPGEENLMMKETVSTVSRRRENR
jgi:hypothetical protein